MRIFIIDSGVRKDHPAFQGDIFQGFSVTATGISNDISDEYGHGTAIYGILRDAREFADIYNVKVTKSGEPVSLGQLVAALRMLDNGEWKPDIINISAGTNLCGDLSPLEDICNRLIQKGTVIISAFDNSGAVSYPAAFSNVIGVDSGAFCRSKRDFEYVQNSIVNIRGYGNTQRLFWNSPDWLLLGGSSFACAHAALQAAKWMHEGYQTRLELLENFQKNAVYVHSLPEDKTRKNQLPHHIEKAALFPFNKEMHSLIRFADQLSFQITAIYDVKYSPNVGTTPAHLLKVTNPTAQLKIQNSNQIDWDGIDTLILGHSEKLSYTIKNPELKSDLLKQAAAHNVFVYAFDDISAEIQALEQAPQYYFPVIGQGNLPPWQFGKLYRIPKPVLGVFGTSSRQGKFTVQLELRKRYLEAGYKIGQIGTEPSALLYGMDSVFPMGYNSSVYIDSFDTIRYLNAEVNRLCQENEIVIVGCQSGTVTFDAGNLQQFTLPQYHFLMGTQPDAVILCVNPYDSQELIGRTVSFLESAIRCKVIAFVIFPMDLKASWSGIYGGKETLHPEKAEQIRQKLSAEFKLPTYLLGDSNEMDALANTSAEYFAAGK